MRSLEHPDLNRVLFVVYLFDDKQEQIQICNDVYREIILKV